MDDYLKYFRVQGVIKGILASDKISSTAIEKHFIAIGTDAGWLHLVNFNGQALKKFKVNDSSSAIISISSPSDGSTVACVSENGIVSQIDLSDSTGGNGASNGGVGIMSLDFKEVIKCVCLDDDISSRTKSMLVGGATGRLIKHSPNHKKDVLLFPGENSAVQSIVWRGSIVAWADATKVRLINVDSQSALYSVTAPAGVSIYNTFPCRLFWESDSSLIIGWADKFRQIDLIKRPNTNSSNGDRDSIAAKISNEWSTDCIIAGVSSFDANHVIVLGYVPPEEDAVAMVDASAITADSIANSSSSSSATDNSQNSMNNSSGRIEVQIINRKTGVITSCDILQIGGSFDLEGPWAFHFLSTFSCYENRDFAKNWKLPDSKDSKENNSSNNSNSNSSNSNSNSSNGSGSSNNSNSSSNNNSNRGGMRGFPPTIFICSPEDVICGKVRDVNDRIAIALRQLDFKSAVTLAQQDRHSLCPLYKYQELLSLYIEDIMDRGDADKAAQECVSLIGTDAELWKVWVLVFIYRKCLPNIALLIPVSEPRLSADLYEEVLETCYKQNPKLFLKLIDKWVRIQPQLFNHSMWLQRFQSAKDLNSYLLQSLALLYLWNKQYEKALNCYMEMSYDDAAEDIKDKKTEDKATYMHVFELIETQNLYSVIKDRIVNLIRLSETLTANLLVKRAELIPVHIVVNQLRGERNRHLLHWYLHVMFTKFEPYNSDSEYAEFHSLQAILYAEYAPKFKKNVEKISFDDEGKNDTDNFITLIEHRKAGKAAESDCMVFLKTSKFYPTDVALDECMKRELYPEVVYLLDIKGLHKHALDIYIRQIGDVSQIINFIESHDERAQVELWNDVVDCSVEKPEFLADLLDFLGICKLNPHNVISRIAKSTKIDKLRRKLVRIFKHYNFIEDTTTKCNSILEEDALESLRRLNQGQRRAIKVSPSTRCVVCARPLSMSAGPSGAGASRDINGSSSSNSSNLPPTIDFDDSQIWGPGSAPPGSVIVFANRVHCHKICLDRAREHNVHS